MPSRTTSALTTAVLGAVLTASTVLAQQLVAPDDSRPEGSSATKSSATLDSTAANSQVYGMTVTRSARVLLRNGLDYLSYQQYDRALKFLRDAEARVNQQKSLKVKKELLELSDAEVLVLKQGIEAAQRGLRLASNAESPYALSDQSRPRNGFTPAKPATQIADNNQTQSRNHTPKATPPAPPGLLGGDGDEQGEPIRLASSETPISDQPTTANSVPHVTDNTKASALAHSESEEPTATPETPQIPTVSRLPDLTEANGSDRLVAADDQGSVKAEPASAPTPTVAPAPAVIDLETIPSSVTVGNAAQPVDPGAVVHKETEDEVPASMPSSAQAGPAVKPTTAATSVAASPVDDELPALPADLSRSAPDARPTDAPATQPASAAARHGAGSAGGRRASFPAGRPGSLC